jgi:hypothetical protein
MDVYYLYLALQLNFYEYKYFPTLVRRFSPDYCQKKISELSKESATIANFDFYLKESEDLLYSRIDGFYKVSRILKNNWVYKTGIAQC